jgi:hypothetical protein
VLPERLGKFGLEVAIDKTRILLFGRNDNDHNKFDFLGFTFYEAKTRKGQYRVGIKTSEKKLKIKRQELRRWIWSRLQFDVEQTMKSLNRKLTGHCNYYGISGNFKKVNAFYYYAKLRMHSMLNRRSQRKSVTWENMVEMWEQYIKPPRIKVNIWQTM